MPEKLVDRLTVLEFLDLLAYLQSLREGWCPRGCWFWGRSGRALERTEQLKVSSLT